MFGIARFVFCIQTLYSPQKSLRENLRALALALLDVKTQLLSAKNKGWRGFPPRRRASPSLLTDLIFFGTKLDDAKDSFKTRGWTPALLRKRCSVLISKDYTNF